MKVSRVFCHAVIASAVVGLSGCLGDGSSSSDAAPPPPVQGATGATLQGRVIAGPVAGATVTAFAVQANGSNGAPLGTATTQPDGSFSLTLSSTPTGAVRLVASGGSYVSEADTAVTVAGTQLSAVIAAVTSAGLANLSVTPLSTLSDQRLVALLASANASALAAALQAADNAVKALYGLQDRSTALSAFAPDFTAASGDAAIMALVIGSLEQLAAQVGKAPLQIVNAIALDFSDGLLDGKAADGTAIKYATGDTTAAPSTLASRQFLNAVSAYTDPTNTRTQAAHNGVTYSPATITALRSGVVAGTSQSSGLDISSSGAITSLTFVDANGATRQGVYFAARNAGLRAIDFTDPAAAAVIDLTSLNAALIDGTSALLPSVDGVIALPLGSGNPQLLLYSYASPKVVLVDAVTLSVVTSQTLAISARMNCSGATPYISGGVADTVGATPTVWLTTGDGYLPVVIGSGTLTAQAAVPAAGSVGMAENVGASVVDRLMFAPGYCDFGTARSAGLAIVDLDAKASFGLDTATYNGGFGSFGEPDAGAVDTALKIGIVVDEHEQDFAFINLNGFKDPTRYTLNATAGTFTPLSPSTQVLHQTLSDLPNVSGINVDSASHLAFIIEESGDRLAVAAVDDPAHPADATKGWAGFSDYRYESSASTTTGSPTRFCAAGDPHSEATVAHFGNGRSYGFALNTCDSRSTSLGKGAVIVDLRNFIGAPAKPGVTHELQSNPFADTTIVQMLPF